MEPTEESQYSGASRKDQDMMQVPSGPVLDEPEAPIFDEPTRAQMKKTLNRWMKSNDEDTEERPIAKKEYVDQVETIYNGFLQKPGVEIPPRNFLANAKNLYLLNQYLAETRTSDDGLIIDYDLGARIYADIAFVDKDISDEETEYWRDYLLDSMPYYQNPEFMSEDPQKIFLEGYPRRENLVRAVTAAMARLAEYRHVGRNVYSIDHPACANNRLYVAAIKKEFGVDDIDYRHLSDSVDNPSFTMQRKLWKILELSGLSDAEALQAFKESENRIRKDLEEDRKSQFEEGGNIEN